MENQNNNEYGQTDPDFIDQNTLVDGSDIQNETHSQPVSNKENKTEFGESDPDYIDQNTLVDNDNYARDEDPYQYQEEFIEDLKHPENDFETNKTKSEDKDQVGNNNNEITHNEKKDNLNDEKE